MTLRLKINLLVAALSLLFAAALLGLQWHGLRASVQEEVVAANRVANQLLQRTARAYAAQGTPAMLAFLQGIGRVRSNDIALFDAQGAELYRSPRATYKAGRDAPAWFSALMAPPLAEQSIAFPDGRLVVQANASRAVLDAWDVAWTLVAACAVLLLSLNAAVFWLVGRALRPLGRVVQALESLQAGRFNTALPPLPGAEAAAIAAAFNRMVAELQGHIETERRAVRAEMQLLDSRALTQWMGQHVEAERKLIARELHDELGQSVTAMRSMALSVASRVQPLDAQAAGAARLIADEASRLYDAMHGIIPRLTPLVLDSFGLAEALQELATRTQQAHPPLQLKLRVELDGATLDSDSALALYRAAQEGITNALRHGQARHIELTLAASAGEVQMKLRDDGCGLPSDWQQRPGHAGEHVGLRWLNERVQGLGGRFRIEAAQPHGVLLQVALPLGLPQPAQVAA